MTKEDKRTKFFQTVCLLITQLKNEGIEMMPFSFHRTPGEQAVLVQQGKSRTMKSKHLDWLAIDFVLVEDGQLVWQRNEKYERMGFLAETLNLTWGGRWQTLNDIYHIEWKD